MNQEEINNFFAETVRRSFAESLYRPASQQDIDNYVERMNQLYISATTENRNQLQAAFNDLLFTAASGGVDLRQIEGAEQIIRFIENRNTELLNNERAQSPLARKPITEITEEIQQAFTSVIGQVISGIVGFSQEAWGKKSQVIQMRSQARKLSEGAFEYTKYLELNTDVAQAYSDRFGSYTSEESREFFSLLHYTQHGFTEGRQTTDIIPEAEPASQEPEPDYSPSFGGGGGFRMPDMSSIFDSVAGSNNRVAELTGQLNSYIEGIASQPQQPLPEVTIPSMPAPITQGNVLQSVALSRRDRGLQEYIGFQETGQTYLQSITNRGRQSTFRRIL